jgi:putative nucleotidyltransferase with HDIG domain
MCHYAEDIKKWFVSYVDSYASTDRNVQYNIDLKKEHTFRVCTEITGIGVSAGLAETDMRLAQTIALLHDIGRFEQYTRFKTFSDKLSVNHAELGVAVIKETGVLRDFPEAERHLITDSISFHNRPCLPDGLTERTSLFAKLIRDADKLDIVHIMTALYRNPDGGARKSFELALPDNPGLSPMAVKAIYRESIVNFADMHSPDDFKLLQMAWIFDLNFAWSLKEFHDRNYLASLREALPDSDTVRDLYSFLQIKLLARLSHD